MHSRPVMDSPHPPPPAIMQSTEAPPVALDNVEAPTPDARTTEAPPVVMDSIEDQLSVMDGVEASSTAVNNINTQLDAPEPAATSRKRDRSPSPLFVQQDEDTTPAPEKEAKRVKLEADPRTPPPCDEVIASQTSGSTSSPNPSDLSVTTHQTSPSLIDEDVIQATAEEAILESPQPISGLSRNTVKEHSQLALQYRNISLPQNCPRLAAYHPLFEQAEKELPRICDVFTSTYDELKSGGFFIEDVDNIHKELMKYRDARQYYSEVKPVALAGVTGAGKSRTLNSILDKEGLALDSDGADRGTNVVHEYVGAEHGQVEKYRVNVSYYSAFQLKTRIADLVASIYGYLTVINSQRDPDEIDEDDDRDRRSKYNAAVCWFRTMLCERAEFQTKDDAEDFLENHVKQKTSEDDLTDILGKYIEAYKDSRQVIDDVESHAASDEAQLSQTFARVAKPHGGEDSRVPHPWRLVRKIEVCVRDNELLRRGATVADTPGVADSDRLVVSNTTMYLQSVGTGLLVSPVLRTQQLTELDDILKLCLELGKADNTYLVLTKTDQCGTPKPHQVAQMKPGFQEAYQAAEKALQVLQDEKKRLETKERDLRSRLDDPKVRVEFPKVLNRIDQIPSMIREKAALRDQVYRDSRHYDIREVMKNKFRDLSKWDRAPDLKVMFVSNEMYQNESHPGRLDIEATGIPGVQRLIYEIPTLDKVGSLQSVANHHVAPSFRSIISSLTQTKLERKAEVETVLCATLKRSPELITSFERSLELVFDEDISACFATHETAWRKKAERLVRAWAEYKPATFTTFCRRGGHWRPLRNEKWIQWNALIQGIFSNDLNEAYKKFSKSFDKAQINAESDVRDWFDKIEKKLRSCPAFMGVSETEQGKIFYAMLHDSRKQTLSVVHGLIDSLHRQLKKVLDDASTTPEDEEKSKTTYVATIMKPTYDAALLIKPEQYTSKTGKTWYKKGKNVHKARVGCVLNKLQGTGAAPKPLAPEKEKTDGEDSAKKETFDKDDESQPCVFQSVFEKVKENYAKRLISFTEHTTGRLQTISDEILADFNRRYSVEEDETAIDPESKKILLEGAEQALSSITEGSFKQKLDECKRWEKEGDIVLQT